MRSSFGKALLPDEHGEFGERGVRAYFDRRLFFAIASSPRPPVRRLAPNLHATLPCIGNIDFPPAEMCEDILQFIIAATKQRNQFWQKNLGARTAGGAFFEFFFEAVQDVEANGAMSNPAKSSRRKKRRRQIAVIGERGESGLRRRR